MYCNQCGKYIPDDSIFCNYCGVNQKLDYAAFQLLHCDICDKDLPDDSIYCNYCGINLSEHEKIKKEAKIREDWENKKIEEMTINELRKKKEELREKNNKLRAELPDGLYWFTNSELEEISEWRDICENEEIIKKIDELLKAKAA